jgi:hypothetical protein
MRFIKRSSRNKPRVSLVLLDWSVRESFHLLDFLTRQTVPREDFEVIIIEYYSRVSEALRPFSVQVDTWLVLDMPPNVYYHKHLMYNAGITVANGDIIMIGDSDAMVKPTFIETIVQNFDTEPNLVYHIDQFRNLRRDFYPFNYPGFDDVLGEGAINNVDGKTAGVLDTVDPIHSRNYGACMCARRSDMIAIGGADMHIDYLGHICGPYDMTFRLMNYGRREVWDMKEFTYHTWHPGQAGADNYLGPHDGRHMSSTALEAVTSGRIGPLTESESIRLLRTAPDSSVDQALAVLIPERAESDWDLAYVEANASHLRWADYKVPIGVYKGFRVTSELGRLFAYPIGESRRELDGQAERPTFEGADRSEIYTRIDAVTAVANALINWAAFGYGLTDRALRWVYSRSQKIPLPLPALARATIGLLALPVALPMMILLVPAPIIGKLRRMWRLERPIERKIADLALTLYNLKKWGELDRSGGGPVLFADDRQSINFLTLLRFLGLAPLLSIRRLNNASMVEAELAALERGGWSGQLLVPGALFKRFRSEIAPAQAARRLIVV